MSALGKFLPNSYIYLQIPTEKQKILSSLPWTKIIKSLSRTINSLIPPSTLHNKPMHNFPLISNKPIPNPHLYLHPPVLPYHLCSSPPQHHQLYLHNPKATHWNFHKPCSSSHIRRYTHCKNSCLPLYSSYFCWINRGIFQIDSTCTKK